MPENAPVPLNRTERVLAAMIGSIIGLSVIAIVATMIGASSGADMRSWFFVFMMQLGYFGLPVAFLLIVTFLVVSTTRRRRIARDGER